MSRKASNWRARLAAQDYAAIAHPKQPRGITRVPTPTVDPIAQLLHDAALPCECDALTGGRCTACQSFDALPAHLANLLMDAYR